MDIIVEVEKKVLVNIDGGRGPQGTQGIDGVNGLSAYEIALENGFVGTEAEWLDSLQGEDGDPATNLVTSVAGRQGVVVLTKADVALGNVDNTSDVNKPISNDTQTALNLKVDKVAGERLINAAEITKLGNQSGVNTGDQDLSGLAVKANNLSDLTNAATARTNLGLGTLATQNGTFSGSSSGTNTGDQNDHGLMAGLGDDDHTQYMLLSGRVGGQTLFDRFSITAPTLTGSSATSALSISQTYNTTGTPTFFELNLTDTASNAASLFVNLRRNGSNVFSVGKTGLVTIGSGSNVGDFTTPAIMFGSTSNGMYLDNNRFFFKAGGLFGGGFDSSGFIGNSIRISTSVSPNNLTTALFIPYRLNAAGLSSGIGGNSIGDVSIITNNSSRIFVGYTGEIGIGTTTPNLSAKLQVVSTTQGFMPPVMTTAQKNAIASPAAGLMVFDTTLMKLCVFTTVWETVTSL